MSSPTRDDLLDQIDRMRIALRDIHDLALKSATALCGQPEYWGEEDKFREIAAMCTTALEAK